MNHSDRYFQPDFGKSDRNGLISMKIFHLLSIVMNLLEYFPLLSTT
jgi:hypothetical protein